jgi:hypothetical protein
VAIPHPCDDGAIARAFAPMLMPRLLFKLDSPDDLARTCYPAPGCSPVLANLSKPRFSRSSGEAAGKAPASCSTRLLVTRGVHKGLRWWSEVGDKSSDFFLGISAVIARAETLYRSVNSYLHFMESDDISLRRHFSGGSIRTAVGRLLAQPLE